MQVQREQIEALTKRVDILERENAELRARLNEPPKNSGNSSVPPSKAFKANKKPDDNKAERTGPRQGSVGRKGGGRLLEREADETLIAKAKRCCHCEAELNDRDQKLRSRYDKIEIPPIKPIVTRVERYAGHCPCCCGVTLAPVPEGMEEGSPFSPNILATALYLRFTCASATSGFASCFCICSRCGSARAPWTPCSKKPSRASTTRLPPFWRGCANPV